MASVNKVILIGNCGRDPEIRYMQDGKAVANVSIATTSKRKDRNSGEVIEDTQWHRVTFYERLAEIVGEYVKKGRPIYVEGKLKYGTYVDKQTGQERSTVEIIATDLQLLGGRDSGAESINAAASPPRPQHPPARNAYADARGVRTPPAQPSPPPSSSGFDEMDDDMPF